MLRNKEDQIFKHSSQLINFCYEKSILYMLDEDLNVLRYDMANVKLAMVHLPQLPNYPDLAKEYRPFDMGYSYVMKVKNGVLGIVSDLGLFVIQFS